MEHRNMSQAMSTLRLKDQNFDFASFSADSFRVQHIIETASSGIVPKLDKGATGNEGFQSYDQISNLLSSFQRLDTQLAELESQVHSRCTSLQDGVAADEAAHVARITVAERELAALSMTLKALETRGDTLTSFGSRVGARLQAVDNQKRRASRAAEALQYLAAFSRSEDLSSLPEIFQDDDRMEEAASIAAQLSTAVENALQSSYGADHGGEAAAHRSSPSPDLRLSPSRFQGHPIPGTLEAAAEQFELYRNVLDNRIVSKFDMAVSSQNFASMAHCAKIMAATGAHGDALLISRYISTRPLFSQPIVNNYSDSNMTSGATTTTDNRSSSPPIQQQSHLSTKLSSPFSTTATVSAAANPPPSSSSTIPSSEVAAVAAMRSLTELYSKLSSTIRDEAVVIEQVFLDSGKAVAALVERIFEQIVQTALETALKPPPMDASLDAVRSHLRLVAEAYRKTLVLAEESTELSGQEGGLVPTELADAACGTALDRYMDLELVWLGGLGNEKLKTAKRTLQKELILDFMSMNEEAVKRCVQVTPAGAAASAIRILFHSGNSTTNNITTPMGTLSNKKAISTTTQACLLGQAGTHMLLGLGGAADRCVSRLAGAFKPDLDADRDAAARSEATASLGTLLQAIAQVTEMSLMLKQHYDRVVAPVVAHSALESAACVEGLAQLVAAIDARTASALERTLQQLFRKVAATLVAEQTKSDFKPPLNKSGKAAGNSTTNSNKGAGSIDTPTNACLSAVALLRAVGQQTAAHLHGSNLSSFLTAFSRRTAAVVETHAVRFIFSPEGALRWRRDVGEFATCMTELGARAAAPAFEDLYSLAGLMIVPPESLPGLLDGVGHLDKARVRVIAERREDWKTARVGDRPLHALF